MIAYIFRRVLYVIPISLGVTILIFALVHIAPGDPLNAVVAPDAPAETVEELRIAYGFDRPLPVQYLIWLRRAVVGDLGVSIATGRPVAGALVIAVPNTLMLAVGASLVGFVLGSIFGGIRGSVAGQAGDHHCDSRNQCTPLLVGHGAGHRFRRRNERTAGNGYGAWWVGRVGVGPSSPTPSGPAGHHASSNSDGNRHSNCASQRVGNPEPGICSDAVFQRPLEPASPSACHQEFSANRVGRHGSAAWLSTWRLNPG